MIEFFEIGRIVKPQGVHGEVKLETYTDDTQRFYDLDFVYLKQGSGFEKIPVQKARVDRNAAYLKLEGIEDRNKAEEMRGQYVYIDRDNAAPLAEGAFYIRDLMGLEVKKDDGEVLGTLTDILQTGAADIYVVSLKEKGTCMFPSVPGLFIKRDIKEGLMVVDATRLEEVAVYDI